MNRKTLKYLLLLSFYNGFRDRFSLWLRIFLISVVILLISYINFFIFPHQWNTHVEPYRNSEFDYFIDISGVLSIGRIIDRNFTPYNFTYDLLSILRTRGYSILDYVLVSNVYVRDFRVQFIILNDIDKIKLTEYNNVVYGRFPNKSEVIISTDILRSFVSISNNVLTLGDSTELVFSGVYMSRESGIVMDLMLFKNISSNIGMELDIFNSISVPSYVYIVSSEDRKRVDLVSAVKDLILFYNETNIIKIDKSRTINDITSLSDYYVQDRISTLNSIETYFYSQYLNPFSTFTIISVGSLFIYILYVTKVVLDVVKDNIDVIGLIYSIGGRDLIVSIFILSTSIMYTVPSIVSAFIILIFWIIRVYGIYLTPVIIFEWLYPYIFTPLVLIFISSIVIALYKVKRETLAKILSLEF